MARGEDEFESPAIDPFECNVTEICAQRLGSENTSSRSLPYTCTRVFSAHVISGKLSFISPLLDYAEGSGFHRTLCVNAHMYI